MKVLALEPFYHGSHRYWLDNLKRTSKHDFELLTSDETSWKRCMRFAAMEFSTKVKTKAKPEILLCSDLLDLATFRCLTASEISQIPAVAYFHENQFAYPWSPHDRDKQKKRDIDFQLSNVRTALAADLLLFNSEYNRSTFFEGATTLLDSKASQDLLADARGRSRILAVGLDIDELEASRVQGKRGEPRLILWNHRWESDKNPELFFDVLRELKSSGVSFRLALVGETPDVVPECFQVAKDEFQNELIAFGHLSREDYLELLWQADILPVTSRQEFFGLSVMEAAYAGARLLLPRRLSYPELFAQQDFGDLFYSCRKELVEKCKSLLLAQASTSLDEKLQEQVKLFSLEKVRDELDMLLEQL